MSVSVSQVEKKPHSEFLYFSPVGFRIYLHSDFFGTVFQIVAEFRSESEGRRFRNPKIYRYTYIDRNGLLLDSTKNTNEGGGYMEGSPCGKGVRGIPCVRAVLYRVVYGPLGEGRGDGIIFFKQIRVC